MWFGSIARAVEECPELVERHYGSVVADDEKFAAGNAAGWRDGVFLHVPAGVEVDAPLRAPSSWPRPGAVHYRALIVLERGARAVFSEEFRRTAAGLRQRGGRAGGRRRRAARVRDHAAAPPEARQFGTHRAVVGRDAELDWVAHRRWAARVPSRAWRATWPTAARTSR